MRFARRRLSGITSNKIQEYWPNRDDLGVMRQLDAWPPAQLLGSWAFNSWVDGFGAVPVKITFMFYPSGGAKEQV